MGQTTQPDKRRLGSVRRTRHTEDQGLNEQSRALSSPDVGTEETDPKEDEALLDTGSERTCGVGKTTWKCRTMDTSDVQHATNINYA